MKRFEAGILSLLVFAAGSASGAEQYSLRNTELLRYECRQESYRRDITLFANGTVRLREGLIGSQSLKLFELEREELLEAWRRLRRIDLSETDDSYESGLGDDWEICTIRYDPKGDGEISEYRFSRMEVSTLAISQVIVIAEDLAKRTRSLNDRGRNIPLDYQPREGDILRRFDGMLFEVRYFTADGLEVELEGIDQPMTLIVPIIELGEVFDSIEPRKEN